MGTKQLLVAATAIAALVGGASPGPAQSPTPEAGPRADRDLLTWKLPVEVEGGRAFVLEVRGTERETVFWQSIADGDTPAVFEAYLEQWPEGTFARLAEIRLEKLRTSSPGDTRLVRTGAGDSRVVRRLLTLLRREGASPQPDENGWTLLHYAAVLDLPDLVRQLMDEDELDDWWRQSFGRSIEEATSDVDARLEDDGHPLSGRLRRSLRRLGLHVDAWTRDGETPLHLAAMLNARGAMGQLLAGGADVHATTSFDWTPLHYAAWTDAGEAAEVLLADDADAEAKAAGGWTPLHVAVWENSYETAAVLLEHGALVAAENDNDETPLELSKSNRMRTLLSRRTRR